MPTFRELTNPQNRFMFRGKIYKFSSYIPVPSIHMVSEGGKIFSFGEDAPIVDEFILITTINIRDPLYTGLKQNLLFE